MEGSRIGGRFAVMKRNKRTRPTSSSKGRRRPKRARPPSERREQAGLIRLQKKALLSVAGVGASGFSDVSTEHDTYLYEKP